MTIVFIANTTQQPLCYKRIREFIAQGYNVETYCFQRDTDTIPLPTDINLHIIGNINSNLSYFQRLKPMYKALKSLLLEKEQNNVLFYYFQLDIALLATHITSHAYIYEEYDLSHTYIKNKIIRRLLEHHDKKIIRKSQLTISTSKGFIQYHFKKYTPNNTIIIPNRLDPAVTKLQYQTQPTDIQHLRFAFVGVIRHKATYNFVKVVTQFFPQHEIHLYGVIRPEWGKDILASKPDNLYIHGTFTNPDDLPHIYQDTDILLSPSDNDNLNGIYSETNKLYEAVYFKKPIVANTNTLTAKEITRLHIGYVIDFNSHQAITEFISHISEKQLKSIASHYAAIPHEYAINNNPELFNKIQIIINQLNYK